MNQAPGDAETVLALVSFKPESFKYSSQSTISYQRGRVPCRHLYAIGGSLTEITKICLLSQEVCSATL